MAADQLRNVSLAGLVVLTDGVDSSLRLDHDGERFWFCGSGCLRAFASNPEAYRTA